MKKNNKKIKGYKSPFVEGEEGMKDRGEGKLSKSDVKEIAEMIEMIGNGEKNGIVIVLEEFTENGRTGMQGISFCNNINPINRIQAIIPALSVPKAAIMAVLHLMDD